MQKCVFFGEENLSRFYFSFFTRLYRILSITFYAIALLTSFSTSAAVISSSKNLPSLECLMSYVNKHGIVVRESFTFKHENENENENKEEGIECAASRQNLISEVRTGIRLQINEAEIAMRHRSCVYEILTGTETFVHSIMEAAIFEYQPRNESRNLLNNTINGILGKIKNSARLCQEYRNKFDKLFENTNKLSAHEEYCIKKYLIKNSLIDVYTYDIDPNPHKINITGLNCVEMIRKSNEEIYEQLTQAYLTEKPLTDSVGGETDRDRELRVECAIEKFREADYFDLMLKITALTTLAITHEQKSLERETFIKAFSKISSNIVATC